MSEEPNPRHARRKRILRAVQIVASLGLVVGIFFGVLPRIADYTAVWATIRSLTWFELITLLGATALNTMAHWPQIVASLPGLSLGQAAVNNQASTTVANLLPGGGMIAVGASYAMYRSWGFQDSAIALSTLVTFFWNVFSKLAFPVVALAILAAQEKASGALLVASLVGVAALAVAVAMLGLMGWKTALAGRIGSGVGSGATFLRKIVRKPPVLGWGERAVRLRTEAIRLVSSRWLALTLFTVGAHIALFFVLVLTVRDVGISPREVSWAQILGVFAFVRLLSALPITPGGLGLVDLGYIGGLVLAGRHQTDVPVEVFRAQVTAAVLVFRALTYGLQLPLGGIAYVVWQRRKSWRRVPVSADPSIGGAS